MTTPCIKKPPRPWSADINSNFKRQPDQQEKCYTTRSDVSHDKYGRFYEATVNSNCCVYECRNPPNTPVNPVLCSRPQLPGRQPITVDEGRCIRLRTISHSAPPLNFKTNWNPLTERHPGSAFDVVSSAGSSRTCTPEQTESRAELCISRPELYNNPIIRPIPRRTSTLKFNQMPDDPALKECDEETLPDKLFKAHIQQNHNRLRKSMMVLDREQNDSAMTLPDKLFKAHMAKLAMEASSSPGGDVQPKILSKSSKGGSVRNGLKDRFVLNIIESFTEQSNVLKELSNMSNNMSSMKLETDKPKKAKKKSFTGLRKTWSSIINLAVGVPGLEHARSKDNLAPARSKRDHADSLYTESMYTSLVGDIYKSRSTACIAAL